MHIATEMLMHVRLKMIFGGMFATNEITVAELAPGNWEIIAEGEKYYAVRVEDSVFVYFVDIDTEIELMAFHY